MNNRKRVLLPGLRVKEGFRQHPFDTEHHVQTSGLIAGRHLGIGHAHDRHSTAYYGVAPSIFRTLCARWLRSKPHFPIERYTFIDFGAGMGRAMLLASEMPFKEVIGVELNPDLVRIAEKNIAIWSNSKRARCPIRIVQQEATEFDFPSNPCVAFLFNPFGAPVLRRMLKRVDSAFEDRPGQLDLLYVNHEAKAVLNRQAGLVRVGIGDIYKSPEDEEADRRIILNQPDGEYGASEYESCSIYRGTGTSTVESAGSPRRTRRSYNQKGMTKKLRVGILFGGRSGEHEVSLLSAASVLNAIDRERYEVVPVGITKEGRWVTGPGAQALLSGDAATRLTAGSKKTSIKPKHLAASDAMEPSMLGHALQVDVIFPVLHGTFGEDGTMQGLFELAGLAYVGSGVLGSAAGMDKDVMKRLFTSAGLPTPRHLSLLRNEWKFTPRKIVKRIEEALKYPVFVKPANLGSSVGISKVHDRKELAPAIELAATYDRKIVVEQGIGGSKRTPSGKARELEVAVLGNDTPEASVVGEIVPAREFYDYEAKYLSDDSVPIIPAKLTRTQAKQIREMAIAAFRACDCAGLARVDFLMEPDSRGSGSKPGKPGRLYVNEVNTLPGFTKISMYPKLWEGSGLAYAELIHRLIELALERRADKDEISYSR